MYLRVISDCDGGKVMLVFGNNGGIVVPTAKHKKTLHPLVYYHILITIFPYWIGYKTEYTL